MFLQGVLLAFTAVLWTALSLPFYNSIETVDLNYHCIQIQGAQETDKSPVLLIHGITSSLSEWSGVQQVLALRTKRRVCAVDLRNHGNSPWTDRSDVAVMAEDIGQFLKKQKMEKVNIIGHSLGGKIAVHYTLNNPNKVNSLVIEDMRPNGIVPEALNPIKYLAKLLQAAINAIPEGQNEEEARKTIAKFLSERLKKIGSTGVVDETAARSFQIRLVDGKWQWQANMKAIVDALDHADEYLTESRGLYEGPALFIYGAISPFDVGGDKDNILKLFPNAKLIPVAGAGHGIHGKHREFEDEVIKLLNGLTM